MKRLLPLIVLVTGSGCWKAHTISRDELLRLQQPDPLKTEHAPGEAHAFGDLDTSVPAAPTVHDSKGKEIEIDRETRIKLRTTTGRVIDGVVPYAFTISSTASGPPAFVFRMDRVPLDELDGFEVHTYDPGTTRAILVAGTAGMLLLLIVVGVAAHTSGN